MANPNPTLLFFKPFNKDRPVQGRVVYVIKETEPGVVHDWDVSRTGRICVGGTPVYFTEGENCKAFVVDAREETRPLGTDRRFQPVVIENHFIHIENHMLLERRDARRTYTLALDDVTHRTFANTYNLALMSALVYREEPVIRQFFHTRFQPMERSEIFPFVDSGLSFPPIVRPAPDADRDSTTYFSTVKFIDCKGVRTVGDHGEVIEGDTCDTQLFVTATPAYILIAVRGTESTSDIANDLDSRPVSWPHPGPTGTQPLQVPGGFCAAFNGALDDLLHALTLDLDEALLPETHLEPTDDPAELALIRAAVSPGK